MPILMKRPPFSIRSTTLFGWFIPILLVFSLFNYREPIPLNLGALVIFWIIGAAIAAPETFRVFKLHDKKESKLITLLSGLALGLGVIALLELKRRGIFIWNELYFTVPMTLFSVVTFAGCFLAENKHSVRVYLALDGYHYVHA
jgi:NhaP-type Na+/H+ or K+/H+ antiporter